MISSEEQEEDENGHRFLCVPQVYFRSKNLENLIKIIDDTYVGKSSRRSLE